MEGGGGEGEADGGGGEGGGKRIVRFAAVRASVTAKTASAGLVTLWITTVTCAHGASERACAISAFQAIPPPPPTPPVFGALAVG